MRIGIAKTDITPPVGVEMAGFGPFLNRRAIAVRDQLWARGLAVEHDGSTVLLIACDLLGLGAADVARIRGYVGAASGLPAEAVMVHCTHTHSGPATGGLHGWGTPHPPYLETLPRRVAAAGLAALDNLREATLHHAEVPCEGVGLNREYDRDAPPLEEVLAEDWRPAHPELTDTTCHVLLARAADSREVLGFASYFGCHPVVCCQQTRYLHGDYAGVATNLLEREHPGSVGLFLQGAQGDVNSCCVHKPEPESLLALDIIAGRYARAVRRGLAAAQPVAVDTVGCALRPVTFSRRLFSRDELAGFLAEQEAVMHAAGADPEDFAVRMATVKALAYRSLLGRMDRGETLQPPTELQGLRLGPISLLGTPFEVFQAIKNDVKAAAQAPVPLVMGLTNDKLGYAPDRTAAARGGYAAEQVPLMLGMLGFANIHEELVRELLAVDAALNG